MALTQAKVDRVTCEGASWTWIADDGKRGLGSGFGLRVYKSGVKSYALRYRAARRLRFYTIGKASILTLDEARERARELLVRIGDGEDPAADRRRSRDTTVGKTTTGGTPEGAKSEVTSERLRAEADALLELAEQQAREQEETRFAAIDLLKRADELESGR
ncbi:Arm DNA-binding domain-containing protein [Gemmatimonadota bacterium]